MNPETAIFLYLLAPNVIAFSFVDGAHEFGAFRDLEPGETVQMEQHQRWVRDADGTVVGGWNAELDQVRLFDRIEPPTLEIAEIDDPQAWTVVVGSREIEVEFVDRRTEPWPLARVGPWNFAGPLKHTVALWLTEDVPAESSTWISGPIEAEGHHIERRPSPSIHVANWRPDDPGKRAFVSAWTGTRGVERSDPPRFQVFADGQMVLSGVAELRHTPGQPDDPRAGDTAKTQVWEIDLDALTEEETYYLSVEGLGTKAFLVRDFAWEEAAFNTLRAVFDRRSTRVMEGQKAFDPSQGDTIYLSEATLMETRNGLNTRGDSDNFSTLVEMRTEGTLDVRGGTYDAGDWDRRIQHLIASRHALDLIDLLPSMRVDLARAVSGVNVMFYRDMRTEDGGVRGGIESEEHPRFAETSWTDSLDEFAYAPDAWSTYLWVASAARHRAELEARDEWSLLRESLPREEILKSMRWAETAYAQMDSTPGSVDDARNLAALELYALTGDETWHELYLRTDTLADGAPIFEWRQNDRRESAYRYLRIDRPKDADHAALCRRELLAFADSVLQAQDASSYGFAKTNPDAPIWYGQLGAPQAVDLVRAHRVSGEDKYLEGAVRAASFTLGGNPLNKSFTTGVGPAWPTYPLDVDFLRLGGEPPAGLTVFGPTDPNQPGMSARWDLIRPFLHPAPESWPATHAYFEFPSFAPMTEFTIHGTMAQALYVYGYLAYRP